MARRRKFDPAELDPEELREEEEENEDAAILRDGQSVRVRLFMRDGGINPGLTPTQRAKALHNRPLVTDGSSNPMAMHKPGFRYLSDARQRAINDGIKNEAYQQVDKEAANAWRNTGASTSTGAPGRRANARDAADAKAAAYAAYDAEMAVAYLRGK
jgi:hypothetical protein